MALRLFVSVMVLTSFCVDGQSTQVSSTVSAGDMSTSLSTASASASLGSSTTSSTASTVISSTISSSITSSTTTSAATSTMNVPSSATTTSSSSTPTSTTPATSSVSTTPVSTPSSSTSAEKSTVIPSSTSSSSSSSSSSSGGGGSSSTSISSSTQSMPIKITTAPAANFATDFPKNDPTYARTVAAVVGGCGLFILNTTFFIAVSLMLRYTVRMERHRMPKVPRKSLTGGGGMFYGGNEVQSNQALFAPSLSATNIVSGASDIQLDVRGGGRGVYHNRAYDSAEDGAKMAGDDSYKPIEIKSQAGRTSHA